MEEQNLRKYKVVLTLHINYMLYCTLCLHWSNDKKTWVKVPRTAHIETKTTEKESTPYSHSGYTDLNFWNQFTDSYILASSQ